MDTRVKTRAQGFSQLEARRPIAEKGCRRIRFCLFLALRPRRSPHKDWRVWAAVVLMLAAILIYVLTLDDSLLSLALRPFVC